MGEVIVITSGKGGVGKTTTTANLGSALALKGKKVALVDTDIGLRNLDVVMGLENRIVYDIVDVVEEKCKLKQALIKDKRFNELYLLPAAQTRDKSAVNEELEKEMDLAYKIVKLCRSARNSANIKNRQPLSEMLISVNTLPEYYAHIVKEELNVKKIELGAEMSDYVNFEIKPNLPVLGKEYGKLIPRIREELGKLNQMELATKVKNGKCEYIEIDDTQIELNADNLLVTMQGKDGFAFSGEGEMGVTVVELKK